MLLRPAALLTAALSLLGTASASAVVDLLPENFDSIVLESGKPALVEFFAPWCGHCKNLAPIYEELGTAFEQLKDKVTIAKVDADAHKALGKRFGVQGFPTLKWFDGKSDKPEDYESGRDLDSLKAFVEKKTGLKGRTPKAPKSNVQLLNDITFSQIVGRDKGVFVAFTAPWCAHCKALAPTWEKIANTFAPERSQLVIAKVDAESPGSRRTAEAYEVSTYPNIKYFPAGTTKPDDYEGRRDIGDFVRFLNDKHGLNRLPGGGLDSSAGTIAALDELVAKFTGKQATLAEVGEEISKAAAGLKDQYAKYYVKVVEKLAANEGYVAKESKRLSGLLSKGGLAPEKADDLIKRSNILGRFSQKVDEATDKVAEATDKVAEATDKVKDEL